MNINDTQTHEIKNTWAFGEIVSVTFKDFQPKSPCVVEHRTFIRSYQSYAANDRKAVEQQKSISQNRKYHTKTVVGVWFQSKKVYRIGFHNLFWKPKDNTPQPLDLDFLRAVDSE